MTSTSSPIHWRVVRERAKARARYCCAECGLSGDLDVHHVSYSRIGAEQAEDVRAICRPCHNKHHPNWVDTRPNQEERMRQLLRIEERYPDPFRKPDTFAAPGSRPEAVHREETSDFDPQEWWDEQVAFSSLQGNDLEEHFT